ncbi:MAG: hypothetical protein AAFY15_14650, partial [Cyanobacteria bacterium J06648_11]
TYHRGYIRKYYFLYFFYQFWLLALSGMRIAQPSPVQALQSLSRPAYGEGRRSRFEGRVRNILRFSAWCYQPLQPMRAIRDREARPADVECFSLSMKRILIIDIQSL